MNIPGGGGCTGEPCWFKKKKKKKKKKNRSRCLEHSLLTAFASSMRLSTARPRYANAEGFR